MNVFEQATEALRDALCQHHFTWPDGSPNIDWEAVVKELALNGYEIVPTIEDPDEVMAFRIRGTNADIIADCFTLGYLTEDGGMILDATYGKGTFWKKHRPPNLWANDLDPTRGTTHWDFTNLPVLDNSYAATVFDPDYKMQGTSSNEGPASSNAAYGMDREYRAVQTQLDIIETGLAECFRVTKPGGMVLVKCMAQVVSGNVVWQDFHVVDLVLQVEENRLIDRFWLLGYRKQPERTHKCPECKGSGVAEIIHDDPRGSPVQHSYERCPSCEGTGREESVQQHSRQNASCLLVFEKGKS